MNQALRGLIRWTGSLAIGLSVVYLLAVAGLFAFGWFDDESATPRRTHAVNLLNELERVRIREELGLDARRKPKVRPPPEPLRMPRQVSGFVQLEVEVGTQGEVVSAEVLGAVPEGYYEQQALDVVRGRRYPPSPLGTYRQPEVIPFTVTTEEPAPPPDG